MVSGTNVVNLSRENQERYEGKVIEITARVLKPKSFPSKFFMPGRMAMTCCADDTSFWGVCLQELLCTETQSRTVGDNPGESQLRKSVDVSGKRTDIECRAY